MGDITVTTRHDALSSLGNGTSGGSDSQKIPRRPFIFHQHIPEPGYSLALGHFAADRGERWEDDDEEFGPSLNVLCPEPELGIVPPTTTVPGIVNFRYQGSYRTISPLDTRPALFREFASLDPSDADAVVTFANEYGLLGIGRSFFPCEVPDHFVARLTPEELEDCRRYWRGQAPRSALQIEWTRIPNVSVQGVEALSDWFVEVVDIRRKLALWDCLTEHRLSDVRDWLEDQGFVDTSPLSQEKLLRKGWAVLTELISYKLWRRVQPDLAMDPDTYAPVLRFYPESLLTGLWLQFAQAIAGNKTYRSCFCGEWFEISASEDGRTARRLFCSDPCKSRDYRDRKAKAEAQYQNGASVEEISRATGTEEATIRHWVGEKKARKRKGKP